MKNKILLIAFLIGITHNSTNANQQDMLKKNSPYNIVFIHLGKTLPSYLSDALFQARLFNPECNILLLANQEALTSYADSDNLAITTIPVETLTQSEAHQNFSALSSLDRGNPNNVYEGFWISASERFLYLHDVMEQFNLQHVCHLENDNMLYVDLATLMPTFEKHYPGIGAVFTHDNRVVPGFVYVRSKESIKQLAQCFADHAHEGLSDMEIFGQFRQEHKELISSLPLIFPAYTKKYELKSLLGATAQESPDFYSNNIDTFNSLFDGAALGQYLGGSDSRNWGTSDEGPGYISPYCVINASHLTFIWKYDRQGRGVPYVSCGNESYRINNLHIHAKKLKPFLSKRKKPIARNYLCGNKFRDLADYIIEQETCTFDPKKVQPRSVIYVKTDYLPYFFSTVFPQLKNPIILISHNSDCSAPDTFKKYLNSPNIIAWFGQNCDDNTHPKFIPIPIGIANQQWKHGNPKIFDHVLDHLEKEVYRPQEKRLYINFSPGTNPVRRQLLKFFKDKQIAFFAQNQSAQGYVHVAPVDFLWEVSRYRYVLSPWGNGLDCHRTWEALLMGAIPVVKTSTLDPLYKDLPVIIVNDWTDITEDFLENKFQQMKATRFNREKLFMDYWTDLIKTCKNDR